MGLRTTTVAKCLEKKLLLFGFEVPDLLAIFLVLSVLNFVFGQTALKIFFVWLPTIALALALRIGKKGKPDNFLIHWLRFQIKPGIYHVFPDASRFEPLPRSKTRKASSQ